MARRNDGIMTGKLPYLRVAGQDRTHFALGTSRAKPANGYWTGCCLKGSGVTNDKQIEDAIAGLSDAEAKRVLIDFMGFDEAEHYMLWRKKSK
jgi:hypothetical protein